MTKVDFDNLLTQGNYLGAYAAIESPENDKATQAALVGELANALVKQLSQDRAKDDKESLSFHRSLLSYILRDFPGLASLYREQLRSGSSKMVPDGVQDLWRDFNDVLSGRKTLDEEIRQRFSEAKRKAEESGFSTENFVKSAENGLRQGFDGLRNFFDGIFGSTLSGGQSSTSNGGGQDSESGVGNGDGDIKIKVENADDPLPGNIHNAQKVDDEQPNEKNKAKK